MTPSRDSFKFLTGKASIMESSNPLAETNRFFGLTGANQENGRPTPARLREAVLVAFVKWERATEALDEATDRLGVNSSEFGDEIDAYYATQRKVVRAIKAASGGDGTGRRPAPVRLADGRLVRLKHAWESELDDMQPAPGVTVYRWIATEVDA
jgi:hypothetical protein